MARKIPAATVLATAAAAATVALALVAAAQQKTDVKLPPGVRLEDQIPVTGTRPPYDPERTTQLIEMWRKRAEADPQGLIDHRELAGAYLARQRETGAIADAVAAEAAARKSLAIREKGNHVAWHRLARALLSQHRFPEAMTAADQAAKLDPSAQRLRTDIFLELGDLARAREALRLAPPIADDLNAMALNSRLAEADGRPEEAIRLLAEAARLADERTDMPHEAAAWYHTMVGHHLIDAGRPDPGEAACKEALAIFPRDYRALTGLSEAAAARGDHAAEARQARAALAIAPENPEALRLLGEALDAQGDAAGAADAYGRLRALAGSFPRIYDRHWALFLADHGKGRDLDDAVAVAREDLALRHDLAAHDTLAWALFRSGKLDEADVESRKSVDGPGPGPVILHHAAEIARARGDAPRAEALKARAVALNPLLAKD